MNRTQPGLAARLAGAVLGSLALGLLFTGQALAECSSCGSSSGKHGSGVRYVGGCGRPDCKDSAAEMRRNDFSYVDPNLPSSCSDRYDHPKDHCGCASQRHCRCRSKNRHCWGGSGVWVDADACCPPVLPVQNVCGKDCACDCGHPYEKCFNGSSMLCDTGCSTYLPCKRVCTECVTKCQEHTSSCDCGGKTEYSVTQDCSAVERPRVVPWWFNGGKGNLYLDQGEALPPMVDDQAGGRRMKDAAGAPEKKAAAPAATPPADSAAPPAAADKAKTDSDNTPADKAK